MEANVNKKFSVSDALYQSVMEVMKGGKEGSIPRNDKEKELAAAYGDPKRITHGDVLKMRGVTKEEVEDLEEDKYDRMLSDMIKKNPDLLKKHAKEVKRSKDIESGKELERQVKKNPGVLKTYSNAVKKDKKMYGEDVDQQDEAMSHQAATTMKHIPNPSPALKKAAKDIKPGIAGYRDRIAMLKAGGVKEEAENVEEGMVDTVKTSVKKVAKKAFKALTGGSDKEQLQDLRKRMGMKENKDTPGNSYEHQCAIHVKSESFGEGRTITTQHAEPDASGNIAWYDVMFEHGIERYVPTNTLEILVSESHMMHTKKKKTM